MFFKKKEKADRAVWIIAGLGNIGPEYDGTRHNCGFMAVDLLAERYGISVTKKRAKGTVGEGKIENCSVVLVKPATYMNLSGECVRGVMDWYKQDTSHLIVIYDDIDIAPGHLRVRAKGSAGSHNGMKSVLQYTEDDCFARVRIGIGKNPPRMDLAKYVLGHFTKEEQPAIRDAVAEAADAVACILREGCEKTMSRFNGAEKTK